jgi:hypothetical protein
MKAVLPAPDPSEVGRERERERERECLPPLRLHPRVEEAPWPPPTGTKMEKGRSVRKQGKGGRTVGLIRPPPPFCQRAPQAAADEQASTARSSRGRPPRKLVEDGHTRTPASGLEQIQVAVPKLGCRAHTRPWPRAAGHGCGGGSRGAGHPSIPRFIRRPGNQGA